LFWVGVYLSAAATISLIALRLAGTASKSEEFPIAI
jgi:hypothetical protein